jgi:predicted nuclease with TOPRIM domain
MAFLSSLMGRIAMGAGLALLAAVAFLWFQLSVTQEKLQNTRADKRAAIAANETLSQTIAMYQARMDALDEINTRLLDRNHSIEREADEQRRAVEDLADDNESVADILGQPLPADLARLLFDPPPASSDTDGDGEGADPEQPAD